METRGLLLGGRCSVAVSPDGFVVKALDSSLACCVGRPDPQAIRDAGPVQVLIPPEEADHVARVLPDWNCVSATIHLLEPGRWPEPDPSVDVQLLQDDFFLALLPEGIRKALPRATVAVAFADGLPASICYSCWETETLWDISIETVPELRRRGLAEACTAFLIRTMRERGKEPVWGAEDSNLPSLRLAAKMGFVPVDRLILFSPPQSLPQ
ncbi:MAG TPA: GNAT family N-acetyltransferase [Thermoanaerobaculia bacterium]|nr:GNAT family N-acetyltransferase [Thermoanaerobaculia bacterium]